MNEPDYVELCKTLAGRWPLTRSERELALAAVQIALQQDEKLREAKLAELEATQCS